MTKESKKGVLVKIKAIFTILVVIGMLGFFASIILPYINPGQEKMFLIELLMGSLVAALIGIFGEDTIENVLHRLKKET
jgi:hypothetical membrane protein